MTEYVKIQDNFIGTYIDNPVDFKGAMDLDISITQTIKADFERSIPITTGTTITFATEGVASPKFIAVKSASPVYVVLNGGTDNILCDPLFIMTNQTGSALTSMKITPVGASAVVCEIIIRA